MIYTTTRCKYCGYATRLHEANVPHPQLDMPLMQCPQCNRLILDPIATDIEFMNESERSKFLNLSRGETMTTIGTGNMIRMGVGAILVVLGIVFAISSGVAALILSAVGAFIFFLGARYAKQNQDLVQGPKVKLAVLASLLRTSNENYRAFLNLCYVNDKNRKFYPIANRDELIKEFTSYKTPEFDTYMQQFEKILFLIQQIIGDDSGNNSYDLQAENITTPQ